MYGHFGTTCLPTSLLPASGRAGVPQHPWPAGLLPPARTEYGFGVENSWLTTRFAGLGWMRIDPARFDERDEDDKRRTLEKCLEDDQTDEPDESRAVNARLAETDSRQNLGASIGDPSQGGGRAIESPNSAVNQRSGDRLTDSGHFGKSEFMRCDVIAATRVLTWAERG